VKLTDEMPTWPNGLPFSGERRTPRTADDPPRTFCSNTAARVRCNGVLGVVFMAKIATCRCFYNMPLSRLTRPTKPGADRPGLLMRATNA